jgi:hypothetical protein
LMVPEAIDIRSLTNTVKGTSGRFYDRGDTQFGC